MRVMGSERYEGILPESRLERSFEPGGAGANLLWGLPYFTTGGADHGGVAAVGIGNFYGIAREG